MEKVLIATNIPDQNNPIALVRALSQDLGPTFARGRLGRHPTTGPWRLKGFQMSKNTQILQMLDTRFLYTKIFFVDKHNLQVF